MPVNISSLAYALSQASKRLNPPLSLSHSQQLIAAALGYGTLAAYQASQEECPTLDEAAHVHLDNDLLDARVHGLGLANSTESVREALLACFKLALRNAQFYTSEEGIVDAIRDYVNSHTLDLASGEIAMTNNVGIDEIYLPFDFNLSELENGGDANDIDIDGHITVDVDQERPYYGHKINASITLSLRKISRAAIALPSIEAQRIKLDWGGSEEEEDSRNMVTMAKALADLLDLDEAEVDILENVEAQPIEGHDDAIYGYILDFTDHASPEVAAWILKKFGTLQVRVDMNFFDNVRVPFEH